MATSPKTFEEIDNLLKLKHEHLEQDRAEFFKTEAEIDALHTSGRGYYEFCKCKNLNKVQ